MCFLSSVRNRTFRKVQPGIPDLSALYEGLGHPQEIGRRLRSLTSLFRSGSAVGIAKVRGQASDGIRG
jgi:hypothetical protein